MSEVNQYTSSIVQPITATILNGQTTSNAINVYGCTIHKIALPAAFDGTTLTFEISIDGGVTFQPYYNVQNIQVAIICTAGRTYGLAPIDLFGAQFLKIVSNAGGGETADRTITLMTSSV